MARILVLDDVEDVTLLVRRILEMQGHEVICFTEEEQAIAFAGSHPIDLAILDIKLKKMSGIEVLKELKGIRPQIGVMLLTGYPSLGTAREAVRLGADEYCVKPFATDELERKVAAILDLVCERASLCPGLST